MSPHEVPVVDDRATAAEWDAYVARRPDASGYHRWAWRRVFEEAFGHATVYLSASRGGVLVGVLPLVLFETALFGRFASSLPYVNYGGILADDEEAARALLASARGLAESRRLQYLELRHLEPHFPELPARGHKVAMRLALADREGTWAALDRKVRNQVRRAEKSGLTRLVGGRELLPEFYAVFARNMRDLGTPVYSRRLFDAVMTHVEDGCSIHAVRDSDRTVAAGLAYVHGETCEVPWASSLREARSSCPNHLLYWGAIGDAIDRGCRVFDFGRSTPGEGTYHFKKQWGAEAHTVCWEYQLFHDRGLPNQSPANPKYRLAIALWKRLPVSLTTALGPAIVRQIP